MKFVVSWPFLLLAWAEGQELATSVEVGPDAPPEPVVSALPSLPDADDEPQFPVAFHSEDEEVAEVQRRAFRWMVRVYNQTADFLRSFFNHLNELDVEDRREISQAAQKVEKVFASTYDEHFLAPDKPTIAPTLRALQEDGTEDLAANDALDEVAAEAEGVDEAVEEFADLVVESTEAALDLDALADVAATTESPMTEVDEHFQDCVSYIVDYATEKIETMLGEQPSSGILSLTITSKLHHPSEAPDDQFENSTDSPPALTL